MKKDSRPQYARIRRIIDLIRAGMETGRYANASLFAREFNVSVRTAMRDLDFLRDEENAPIEYDASRKGYYLCDVSWNRELFANLRRQNRLMGPDGLWLAVTGSVSAQSLRQAGTSCRTAAPSDGTAGTPDLLP